MEVGQVGFHDEKAVKHVFVERKLNDVVNRLNKTRDERYPDLRAEREAYDVETKAARRAQARDQKKAEVEAARARQEAEELKARGGAHCGDGGLWAFATERKAEGTIRSARMPSSRLIPAPLPRARSISPLPCRRGTVLRVNHAGRPHDLQQERACGAFLHS